MEAAEPLQARFQLRLAPPRGGVPRLEVRQNRDGLLERVDRGIFQGGKLRRSPHSEEPGQRQSRSRRGLRGRPSGRVGEKLREEVRQRVAQRAADLGRIGVLLEVLGEPPDGHRSELPAPLPRVEVSVARLLEDLLARPRLQVRAGRIDPLALADLPRVGPRVVDEGVRVEEIQRDPREQPLRPLLFAEETDGGLEAVQRRLQLHVPDERPGPVFLVPTSRRGEDRVHLRQGLRELLLGDEPVHFRPVRGRSDGGRLRGRFRWIIARRLLGQKRASPGRRGEQEDQRMRVESARFSTHPSFCQQRNPMTGRSSRRGVEGLELSV